MDNKIENKKPKDEIEQATSPELQILSSVPAAAQNLLPKSLFTGLRPPLYPLHPGSYPYSLLSPSEMSQFSPWWVRHKKNLNSFLNSHIPGLAIIFWRKVIILHQFLSYQKWQVWWHCMTANFRFSKTFDHFWHFKRFFVHSKCKSSLRLYFWFSNTVSNVKKNWFF